LLWSAWSDGGPSTLRISAAFDPEGDFLVLSSGDDPVDSREPSDATAFRMARTVSRKPDNHRSGPAMTSGAVDDEDVERSFGRRPSCGTQASSL
jgi:hypothetical protein